MTSIPSCSYKLIGNENIYQTNHEVKMGGKFDKFLLLMWKNTVLQYRRPIQTLVEIIAPVIFSILLVVIRGLVDPEEHDIKIYEPFCPLPLPVICQDNFNTTRSKFLEMTKYRSVLDSLSNYSLIYSPSNNTQLDAAMSMFSISNLSIFKQVIGFENAKQLESYYIISESNNIFAALQFNDNLYGKQKLPEKLDMKIRFPAELRSGSDIMGQNNWLTSLLYPVYQMAGPRNSDDITGANPNYYREGYLTLQTITTYFLMLTARFNLNTSIVIDDFQNMLKEILPPIVKMQRFPYSKWTEDPLLQALESFAGIIIMLSFVYTCINTVKMITTEKEKQLKESMKIMGLPNWLHWTAWFLKTYIFLLISIILIIVLLTVSWYPSTTFSVFTYADPSVLLVFMLLYMAATVTFCFGISVFFSKANTAATIAGLAWFLSYSPYMFLQNTYGSLSLSTKLFASIGSNSAMAFGLQLMLMFEGTGEGIQWSNIWKTNTPDDNITLGYIMIMLIVDALLYLLIALYIEAVFPGEYGVPQKWYYPFTSTYWLGHKRNASVEDFQSISTNDGEFFEKDPDNLNAGIHIRNLRKVFKNKAAVRNLSLNMYEGQITVLLGHNGAGKTTTMSMLTGMFPPTSGTALVDGHDICIDMNGVRASLGLCPQHNILFDDLTVREHIYFFSRLKGLQKSEINKEIKKYLQLLELEPKANAKTGMLSGGMKRKLCVGMALCGNSKVVMLDEPTAGMDPSARRALWNLLQEQKEDRTMLLTTHFMDEADLLGDRIAIMAGGELQCCGTSFFLKKKYGAGYHLIMDKNIDCDTEQVTALLQKYIPNLEVHSNIGSELTYLLAESELPIFEKMLHDLEQNTDRLGVNSYGISLTTLEEVFMKVGADHGQEEAYNINHNHNSKPTIKSRLLKLFKLNKKHEIVEQSNGNHQLFVPVNANHFNGNDKEFDNVQLTIESTHLLSGFQLICNQYIAMFMKKCLSILRTWILQLIQLFMPVVFLIIAIIVMRNSNEIGDLPEMPLTLNKYDHSITLIDTESNSDITNIYTNMLKSYNQESQTVENITERMLDLTSTLPLTVRMKYIVGASFKNPIIPIVGPSTIIAWFNNDPYHSPPLALGLVLNAVFKSILNSTYDITFSNYPLPYSSETKIKKLLEGGTMGFQLAFNLGFSMAFVSSFYVLFYVKERVCKSKHLQFVSGVKVFIFWTTSFICDLINFILIEIAIIITFIIFQENGFKSVDELGRLFLILFYFGFSMLPMMYFASYLFEIPSTGYTRMTLFSIFTGVAAFLVIQVLGTDGLNLEYVANGLHWAFLLIPHYSLSTGLRDSYTTYSSSEICNFVVENCMQTCSMCSEDDCWYLSCHNSTTLANYCCDREQNYFKWSSPGIGRNLLYSFLVGIILFTLLLLNEYRVFERIKYAITQKMYKRKPQPNVSEDIDVHKEKDKIHNTLEDELINEYSVVLKDVTKYYKNFLAVNGLCLGIKQFECFGLLGVNGAGKTTTFKMMSGDVKISYGKAWVNGFSIQNDLKNVQKIIGYCPQFDALLDDLTANETLTMFALLRGVPYNECKNLCDKLAMDFDFNRHLHKQVKELSGGNKRKLSTAISLIGDPAVLYLDEPTTGMDPATKRYLWNVLCQVRDSGKCIILTSHSMEECEALCTRLAIMVNGEFKCLGSTQHLKHKFAEGYTLIIKVKKLSGSQGLQHADTEPINRFVMEHFPKAILREHHQELLTYYITDKSIPWSRMFGILERGKMELNIEDYSLGQSSLEQVFLTFTKFQNE